METRFIRRPDIASQYNDILKEYLRLGHMELAAQPSTYLLPHHCVCKPTSTTTKVRVVFNASAPDVTGISLNQRLLPGPKLQNDLANILLAFRFHAIAICADMKMMYRQILVDPDQRNVQHIFWRSSPEAAIQEFQLNTLTFGFSPAPYLAQRVIKQLVYDDGRNLSLASRALIEHTYVDDIVTGANTLSEAQQLQSDLITLLGKGGFELRKWASNDPAALKSFPPDHLETPVIFSKNELGIKILGLMWDPKSDIFTYHVLPFEGPITKRSVLSYIARIFDPLGWLTPVVFWTKHFLQQLWMSKLDWDETFSNPLLKLWSEYTSEMHLLSTVKIPRHIPHSSYQQRLVGFCDASEKGYAASVYLHLTYADSVSNHFLLKAKSKVAPLKCLSIPRLELSAALLLAKLVSDILNFLSRLDFEDIRLFTDSTIVLAWINTPPHTLKTFVANRVVAILEMTSATQWGHIISEDNPADAGSRGLSPSQLVEHTLWWKGPAFLSSPISLWPCCYKFTLPEDSISELKSNIVSLKVEIISSYLNEVINKFSSLSRLLRTFAFLLRFMDNIRSIPHTRMKHVSVDDLRQATMICARVTQQNYYSELYNDLKNNSDIKNSLRMLSPFIDSDGLIRVGGRLRNSQLSKEAKYPILVPKTSHLAVLICDNYHLKSLHAGPRTVIALIQQKFWIVSLRSLIRQRIYRCLRCYKFKSKPQQPYMADLPSVRIQLVRAFHAVGMDFAGPFSVKESLRRKAHVSKGYLCIFVCMATKALHLEMVSELSTNAFLAALERFIARRGLPRHLYSDCGRNFVGAARHLKEVRQFLQEKDNDIFSNLASKEIKWHFNPPAAPNFGGIWESAVKSAKNLLLRLIGDSSQTFEEFSTLFARIEAVLNSRPLCATSSDPNDGVDYLSPGHFLIGSSLLNAPEFGLEENLTFHYNRSIAFKSYLNMETRFIRRPEIASQYNDILKEYLRLGHMELAAQPSTYLLPHHCVCKPTSTTTKVRVVFNASAPDVTGISLNQRLLPGPKLQNDLANILLAFRFHAIAICADMKMMYRQILVDPDQRNVQHIFWRSSPEAAIQEFQLNTLTFGFSPAPYLAQRVIKQLVYDDGRNLSLASRALIEHTYVDDIVTGANTLSEAQQLQSDLITLLGKGGFELRKWASNDPAALKSFPPDHLETPVIFSKNELGIKILGLMWDPKSDIFTYHVLPFEGPITKRSVLSYIARIFDPLGWLTPVVFWTKHFLQQLWMSKLDWDETFSNPLLKLWSEYTSEMHLLSTVKIPRHIPHSSYQQRLVGFCDASEKGYAASVYLHLTYADSVSNHFLLKAKSKVAPLKCLSIPRLELSAALLLAKLVSDILNFLSRLDFEDIRLFTDSTIVLAWINTPPHTLKTFVANRVVAILEMTSANQWGHIISEDNPADAGSRGLSPSQLVEHTLWWKGPAFLSSPISLWPCCYKFTLPEDSISELKSNIVSLKVEIISSYLNEVINKFSSLSRLLRTFAFLLRFMDNIRSIPHTRMKHVSVDDLRQATMVCARVTQQNYYSELYNDLKNNSDIKNSLRMLSPFIDSDGLIRVGGRLRNSQLSKEAKYPILVPKTSHLAVLICDNYHLKSLHAGPRTVIALIQQKFWIVSLRSLIRQRIYRCLRCYKFKSKPQQPYMADLPSVRIQLVRAFHAVGMDFAGPFSVKESLRRKAHVSKGYLCIFVCMATKALHLEMVSELSTNAFLAALERFIARRGLPRHLYSDCGRNFVGAARHLKEVRQFLQEKDNDIFSNLASKEIKWHFNPPAAPNFGGIWESAVKSAKNLLLRLIGDSSQTFEEFSTLFARIEAVLNSRPLCATSSDPNDGVDYLSPGHFLIGSSLLNAPEFGLEENLTFHCRWQRQRQLYQTFWKRWSTE